MRINLQIDRDNDQLYLAFASSTLASRGSAARTVKVNENIYADFDEKGRLLGLDISSASQVFSDGDLDEITFDHLVGVKEAAALIGVKRSNFIRDYANSFDFPKPVVELASGRIWLRSDVESYLRAKARRERTERHRAASPLVSTLSAMFSRDPIAFRHVVLRHFEQRLSGTRLTAPTLEEVALDSLREDRRILDLLRAGSEEEYFACAEQLFRKYYGASKSMVRSLLGPKNAEKTDLVFKEIWAEALRQAQVTDKPLGREGTFPRWLLALSYEFMRRYQFPIDKEAGRHLDEKFDPIHATVVLENFRKAKDRHAKQTQELEAERFVLRYLQSLSIEEISEFFSGRHSAEQIARTRKSMMSPSRRSSLGEPRQKGSPTPSEE